MAGRGDDSIMLKANTDYHSQEPVETVDINGPDQEVKPETVHKALESYDQRIAQIAKGQADLAMGMTAILNHLSSSVDLADDEDEDDDDYEDEDEDEDKDERMDKARIGGYGKLRASKAKLMKDDTATSFGEMDDDLPGNRPFNPADTSAADTVITGRPGQGPGPMNGTLRKAIADEVTSNVLKALQSAGVVPPTTQINKSADTPEPGAAPEDYTYSSVNKAVEETGNLVGQFAKLPWGEINRARFEFAPNSVLPFPIFGQQYNG